MQMKDDIENRRGIPAPPSSRRQFIRMAAAAGGAGILSAGVQISAPGSATKAAQIVLPTTTKDVTPFKVSVPQSAIDDLKRRLASTRWPVQETVGDWPQGAPLQTAQPLVAYWRARYDRPRFDARIHPCPQSRPATHVW